MSSEPPGQGEEMKGSGRTLRELLQTSLEKAEVILDTSRAMRQTTDINQILTLLANQRRTVDEFVTNATAIQETPLCMRSDKEKQDLCEICEAVVTALSDVMRIDQTTQSFLTEQRARI